VEVDSDNVFEFVEWTPRDILDAVADGQNPVLCMLSGGYVHLGRPCPG
jgi:hypothetical protein